MNRIAFAAAAGAVLATTALVPTASAQPTEKHPAAFVAWVQSNLPASAGTWSRAQIIAEARHACAHGPGYSSTLTQATDLTASQARRFVAKSLSIYCPTSGKPNKPGSSEGPVPTTFAA